MKGIGTDIIEISRIKVALERTPSFLEKVYTIKEQEDKQGKKKKVESLAGLFCAKEAVSKALGTGFRGFNLKDIEIISDTLGKPQVLLHGEAKHRAKLMGIKEIAISISHCKEYATAVAIAEGEDQE